MKVLKEKKGITLVALVITIIVLLILAGVTLSLVLGDNGVVTKADEAKTASNQKDVEEQLKLKVQEYLTNNDGEFNKSSFLNTLSSDFTKNGDGTVTKDGVTLSIGTKGEIAIVNEVSDTYVSSPEEMFLTEENEDGTLSIIGLDETVVTKSEKENPAGPNGNRKTYEFYYDGNLITEIAIPKMIDGKVVKTLGKNGYVNFGEAKWGSSYLSILGIESVVIPEGIEKINGGCFSAFYDLLEVTIPSTVNYIGSRAFQGDGENTGYGRIESINVVGKSARPEGWDSSWCPDNCEIVWNYSE